jgi:hypothetical protein
MFNQIDVFNDCACDDPINLECFCNLYQSQMSLGDRDFRSVEDPAVKELMKKYFADALAKVMCPLAGSSVTLIISRL